MMKKKATGKWLVFVLIMAIAMMPVTVYGAETDAGSAKQIGSKYVDVYGADDPAGTEGAIDTGNDGYEKSLKKEESDGLWVEYSKEVEATTTEDVFKIDLKVRTNEIREIKTEASDVVLVFDASGSMDYSLDGTRNPGTNAQTPWKLYKESMITFIDSYLGADAVDGNRLSIVVFAGDSSSKVLCEWTSSASSAKATFSNYNSASALRSGINLSSEYTNASAGYIGATAQLGKNNTPNPHGTVIFVSDGNPNVPNASSGATNAIASSGNTKTALRTIYGSTGKYNLYTFAIGKETAENGIMSPSENPNVNRMFTATDATKIAEVFEAITYIITHDVKVWTVKDPMSKWVTFEGFIEAKQATYDDSSQTITWKLDEINPANIGTEEEPLYQYTMSYYGKLNKSAEGYEDNVYYPTNKETTLEYAFAFDGTEENEEIAKFRIPTICGFPESTPPPEEEIKGETATQPTEPGDVMGEEADDPEDQTVLGEESKTADMMGMMSYLILMAMMAAAVVLTALRKMSAEK